MATSANEIETKLQQKDMVTGRPKTIGEKLSGVYCGNADINDSLQERIRRKSQAFIDVIEDAAWGNFKGGKVIDDNHITKQMLVQAQLLVLQAQQLAEKAINFEF